MWRAITAILYVGRSAGGRRRCRPLSLTNPAFQYFNQIICFFPGSGCGTLPEFRILIRFRRLRPPLHRHSKSTNLENERKIQRVWIELLGGGGTCTCVFSVRRWRRCACWIWPTCRSTDPVMHVSRGATNENVCSHLPPVIPAADYR